MRYAMQSIHDILVPRKRHPLGKRVARYRYALDLLANETLESPALVGKLGITSVSRLL